ncbi:aminotransferase class V-fold PLP-dependent enzyme [Arthrobacter sp. CG_A4]|uniref:aminotransferase class V-fold PLP-dependent enzyme n=1 Tax=Arthrobacter sp. CG_A4 TaxID=3071706 RepID=UPI002E08F25E|nr:selenocysteine lyase/cysteine desulfurase [Arthrobacter sp. CG_A4]
MVGRLCRKAGVPFVLDACQSVGQLPLDVAELKCDILVGTGRKFLRGPRGTASVYLDSHVLEKVVPTPNDRRPLFAAIQDEPPSARLPESREASIAARLGLGRAAEYALELGIEDIRGRLQTLADGMRLHLADIRGVELYGRGKQASGIVTFSVREKMAVQVKEHLAVDGINLSTVPLPPLKPDAVLQETPATPSTAVRASVHCYNTEAEIDRLASALRRLVSRVN